MTTKASGTTTKNGKSKKKEETCAPANGAEHHQQHSINLNIRGIGESATLSINEECTRLRNAGIKVYNFGLGQSPFPVPRPVVQALKLHAHEKDYLPVRGLPELKEAVAGFHRRLDAVEASADRVMVGPGSKELMFLLQMVFYGELILPSPCWVSYGPQARILGKQLRIIPTSFSERWQLSAQSLENFLADENDAERPRMLVLNYPGNPDGLTYPADELKALAEVAARYGVLVLSDEIYGRLHHKGQHVSIARYYPEGTIISSGLSKWCGAGGWRLGTMTFPPALEWLMEAMSFVASETYTSVSAPIQHAAVRAFRGGIEIERYLRHSRRILAGLGSRIHGILTGAGLLVHPPEGAFYLFVDFEPHREALAAKDIRTGHELCRRLLAEESVAVLPGAPFERPRTELTIRMSYINFDGASALAASESVPPADALGDEFFEYHCGKSLEGARKIAEWITSLYGG